MRSPRWRNCAAEAGGTQVGARGFGRVWSFRGAMTTSQGLRSSLAAQWWRLIVTPLG